MSWIPFLIIGLTSGSIYAIVGLGLVLSYRTSGIFNFGYGAVAAAAAYLYFQLHSKWGMPAWLAVVAVIFVAGPLAGLLFELMGRGLDGVTTTAKISATIGLLLGVEALLTVLYGAQGRPFPNILPTDTYRLGSVHVGVDQTITVVLGAVATVALYAYLRYSKLGVAMRGVVESSDLLGLTGNSPWATRSVAWVIGASFAALSGLLLGPSTGLNPLSLVLVVVQAFSAAAVGSFSSLPLTYAGGLLVGVVYALADKIAAGPAAHIQWVQGLPSSTPFLVLFAVLVFSPARKFQDVLNPAPPRRKLPRRYPAPLKVSATGAVAAAAIAVPWIVGVKLPIYSNGMCMVILFASLSLLVRTSGQISLAHFGFAAIGGALMSHLTEGAHLPWLIALAIAALCAVPVGVLLAVPAIRLSGLYLALATFGFGILLANLVYPLGFMFRPFGVLQATRPKLGFIDGNNPKTFYLVALLISAMVLTFVVLIERSRLGRLLRGMSDSPVALTIRGANVNTTRVLVFGISAFLAALAGALYSSSVGFVSSSTFPWLDSLVILAILFTVGGGTIRAPLLAAFAFTVLPSYITSQKLVESLPMLFGLSAIVVAMQPFDLSGLKARLASLAETWDVRRHSSPALSRTPELSPRSGLAAGSQ